MATLQLSMSSMSPVSAIVCLFLAHLTKELYEGRGIGLFLGGIVMECGLMSDNRGGLYVHPSG